MDRPFPIKSTLLALLLALPVMAGERDERSMGDDAFSRGDYAGAVQFYSKALLYAKDKRWNEDALLLARAQLRAGDVAGAEKTYAEYRKRNPEGGNSAGMLPGELMLAAKNYSDAARYFSRLGETSPNPELQCSARFAAAAAFAEAGDFASAEAIYGELEKRYADSKRWSQEAHFGLINTLIRSRQFERAAVLLKERKYFGTRSEQYLYNEMFRAAQIAFEEDTGFCFLTGANGGGKTTYLRTVAIKVCPMTYIVNTHASDLSLLKRRLLFRLCL